MTWYRYRATTSTFLSLLVLAALTSTASGHRLSASTQSFRAGFSTFSTEGLFGVTECALTIEGSLHSRTIIKEISSLIGYITRAILGACSRGSATILTGTLPWHFRYRGYVSALPNITELDTDLLGSGIQIKEPIFNITCLTSGGAPFLNFSREGGGRLTGARINGRAPSNCGADLELHGTSNSISAITVTLI